MKQSESSKLPSFLKKINLSLENLRGIPSSEKLFFVQYLGVMIKAGLSLSPSLKTLAKQTKNKNFKRILLSVQQNIEIGESFSYSLSQHPKVFKELFVNMIEAGETSGNLEKVLSQLHIQMKKDHDLISKIKGALIYPIIVIIAMIGIGTAMIVFVIPKISEVYKEVNATLPLATRALISLSDFVVNNGLMAGTATVILIILIIKIINTPKGKYQFDKLLLKLPIIATIIKKINLARFARTLGSLLKTDIPIIKSFQITSKVLGNSLYREAVKTTTQDLEKGVSIEETLKKFSHLFPPTVIQMIATGEQSGTTDEMLENLANFYEEEVNRTMENLPSVIEPILIIVLGVAVAAMAIAIIMPMYSLTQAI